MRRWFIALILILAAAPARAAGGESAVDPRTDPAACVAASASDDAGKIATCGALIDSDKTPRPDRIKALTARSGFYERKGDLVRAIADLDAALRLDPSQADLLVARGELFRAKGDRPRAVADFAAALKLNPEHAAARANTKALAQELEKLGAQIALHGKPSFHCASARRAVEKAICADPELADLDREINVVYLRVLREAQNPAAARPLQRNQDAYLATRNAAFGRPGYDLRAAMKARLRELTGVDGY